jgi:hypothetical protein
LIQPNAGEVRAIPIICGQSYALSGEEKRVRAAGCDPKLPFNPRYWQKLDKGRASIGDRSTMRGRAAWTCKQTQ